MQLTVDVAIKRREATNTDKILDSHRNSEALVTNKELRDSPVWNRPVPARKHACQRFNVQ